VTEKSEFVHSPFAELAREIQARTPARLLTGRSGTAYRTSTHLQLRQDHAAARDAVQTELQLNSQSIEEFRLFEVQTLAKSKTEYLQRPDLGRKLRDVAKELIRCNCPVQPQWQIVIGDGLSATAITKQVPALLPLLLAEGQRRNLTLGQPFIIRYCRVGVLNEIGELLDPAVAVLLIGERPGLATAESLSVYMAYRPRTGHTDAQRNLISNIHARGIGHAEAVRRIANLAERMMTLQQSGVSVKE
jgi:ethanolamine ammonia-lyase small subunit